MDYYLPSNTTQGASTGAYASPYALDPFMYGGQSSVSQGVNPNNNYNFSALQNAYELLLKNQTNGSLANQVGTGAELAGGSLQNNQQSYLNQMQNNIYNALGIPALQQQYGALGQQFGLWLADKNFAAQFPGVSSNATMNPLSDPNLQASAQQNQSQLQSQNQADMSQVGNMTTGSQGGATTAAPTAPTTPANPYLASASALTTAGQNIPVAPSTETGEMGAEANAAESIGNLLDQLIGAEQSYGNQQVNALSGSYSNTLSAINNLANYAQGLASQDQANTQPGTAAYQQAVIGKLYSDLGNKMTLQEALPKYEQLGMTPNDIYAAYNTVNQPGVGYGPAKQNAQQLAALGITGAPVTTATATQKAAATPGKTITTGTGNAKQVWEWDPKTSSYDINVTPSQQAQGGNNILGDIMNFLFQAPQPIQSSSNSSSSGGWE